MKDEGALFNRSSRLAFGAFALSVITLLTLFLSSTPAAFAADGGFEVSFSINRQKATIGDDIVIAADIVHDDLFQVLDLPKDLAAPPFIVKKIERIAPKKAKGVTADAFRVTLTVFETGKFVVPSIAIRFKDPKGKAGVVYTEKWPVEVFSVLGNQKDTGDIRPLKSPESLETEAQRRRRWIMWAVGIMTLLVAALLGWLGWRQYEAWLEARKPAHQRALEALDRLEKKNLITAGQPKVFFAELTLIMKHYLIRRFDAGSLEHTTREFLADLEKNPQVAAAADDAKLVLTAADLVKFAREMPSVEDARVNLQTVRELVQRTALEIRKSPEKKKS